MKRILVAEDNDSNYMLMQYILKKHFEFFRAVNGKDAIEKALAEHPDLILMDIKMPLMDGLEATRQIKAQCPSLPIVALTANAFDSDRQQALAAGCDEFLTKPINADLCIKTIKRLTGE